MSSYPCSATLAAEGHSEMSSSRNGQQTQSPIEHQTLSHVGNNDNSDRRHTAMKNNRNTDVPAPQTQGKSSISKSTARPEPGSQNVSDSQGGLPASLQPYQLNIDNTDTLAESLRQQLPEEIVGDSPYSSFLDFTHLYEQQGDLADQRQELIQGLDDGVLEHFGGNETTSTSTMNPSGGTREEHAPSSTVPAPPQSAHGGFLPPSHARPLQPPQSASRREEGSDPRSRTQTNTREHKDAAASSAMAPSCTPSASTSPQNAGSPPQNFDKVTESTTKHMGTGNKIPQKGSGAGRATGVFATAGILRQSASDPPPAEIAGTTTTPTTLPSEKVFSIQIGSEIFRLSGASISSDAPSYFSQFFEEQVHQTAKGGTVRTLYIDRDPVTFSEICRHLQGYHVRPRDGEQFVKLFADAQFYSLPRLVSQLFDSEIFIQIGDRHFQIPRDVFSGPGDSPNFFSLGFAIFFTTPSEVFPGLDRRSLLRPPAIVPPSVPHRSGDIFEELLHLLRGYPVTIRDETHRAQLLRDCRYFHLRGIEQKLIPHNISYNPERKTSEIIIRLEDIRQSGIQFITDSTPLGDPSTSGFVQYARPFADEIAYELIVEIAGQSTVLDLETMRADFRGLSKARVASLVQVVANKLNLPTKAPLGLMMMAGGASKHPASPAHTPLSEDQPKIRIGRDADITVDGVPYIVGPGGFGMGTETSTAPTPVTPIQRPPAKRKRLDEELEHERGEWMVYKGQWRLQLQPKPEVMDRAEIVFHAVKLDVFTSQRTRNQRRGFLD